MRKYSPVIGLMAIITAMAGVTKSVAPKDVLIGIPARPMKDFKTNFALLNKLPKLFERVKKLEEGTDGRE